jgi:transposase
VYLCAKSKRGYDYWMVVEGHRREGKQRQDTVLYIGRVDTLHGEKLQEKLHDVAALGDPEVFQSFIELLVITGHSPFELCQYRHAVSWGDVAALWSLARELGLPEVIQDNVAKGGGVPAGVLATVVAINAATEATSKRGMRDWYEDTALDGLTGLTGANVEEDNIYSCMDALTEEAIAGIERELVRALVETYEIPMDVLLYDLTSTFLYGKMCPLGEKGYSRDHRGDLKQLVLAVAVTREHGFPVKHWLYPGNTTDVTTLPRLAADFKELHGRHVLMLVFDRGAQSEKNVKVLDKERYQFLCGLKRKEKDVRSVIRRVRDEGEFELVKEAKYDGGDTGFVWGSATVAKLYGKERRVVVCYSEAQMAHEVNAQKKAIHDAALALREIEGLCRERRYRHDSLVVKIHEATEGVKGFFEVEYEDVKEGYELRYGRRASASKVDGRKLRWAEGRLEELRRLSVEGAMGKEEVRAASREAVGEHRRYFNLRVEKRPESSTFTWRVDAGKVVASRELFGYHALMTTDLTMGLHEVVGVDDNRDVVEKCHEVMKSYVRVRPVRHWAPRRVRAHIYLCILGYFLRQLLKLKMERGGMEMSVREALMRLRRVRLVDVMCGGMLVDRQLTSIDGSQLKLLELSGCSEDIASVGEGI